MFKHILVPVDFTPKNQASLLAARQLAQGGHARITLLHVIESIDYPEDEEITSFYEKLRQRSEKEMDRLLASFDAGDDVAVETIVGNRGRGIVLYAAENDVDLIVMNSHVVDPDHKTPGWGTISYQVSALCHCSIMLVKQPVGTSTHRAAVGSG